MKKKKEKNRFWINWIYLLLIIACIFTNVFYKDFEKLLYLYPDYCYSGNTEIHYIDVGQGDSIAIKFSSGKVVLIDSGLRSCKKKLFSYLDRVVLYKNKTIDYLILTHIDDDHIGNMLDIINYYDVKQLYRPPILANCEGGQNFNSNALFDKLIETAIAKNIKLVNNESGHVLNIDECILEWFAPLNLNDKENILSNNYSPIIKLTSGNSSALFTGDADSTVEKEVLECYGDKLDVDILKIAHHGSSFSTSLEFLERASPNYACISVGENAYNHPSNEVIQRILKYDEIYNQSLYKNTYITKELGNIYITLDEDDIVVDNISNIDDYVFVDYYVYSIIAILTILFIMGLPYYRDIAKSIVFFIRNLRQKHIKK